MARDVSFVGREKETESGTGVENRNERERERVAERERERCTRRINISAGWPILIYHWRYFDNYAG